MILLGGPVIFINPSYDHQRTNQNELTLPTDQNNLQLTDTTQVLQLVTSQRK